MKKIFLFAVVFINISFCFAQQQTASFEPSVKEKKDVFTVVNSKDNKVALFFSDKKSISALLFDEGLKLSDTITTTYSNKEVDDIIGYSYTGQKYYVYWSGSEDTQIIAQCYDFDAKKSNSSPISIDIGKEKIIDKITIQNTFYIITALKHTSILNFYCFTDGKMNKKTVDCSNYRFIDSSSKKVSFWEMYNEFSSTIYYNGINNILDETPASLVLSTHKKKAFVNGNSIIFTFDTNEDFTQTLTINLSDFSATQKAFAQVPMPKREMGEIDSNSFFVNNNMIQIKSDWSVIYVTVKDMSGIELKKLAMYPGKEIEFKNSEIIQENGGINSTRILDKSSQLVRKISNLNPSVSSYFYNGRYNLVIGGVSNPQQDGVLIGAMVGGFTGAMIGAAISSNYSMNNLSSYNDRMVVYINCLFDQDFNHIKEEGKKLAFDKLRVFEEENKKILMNQSIFKLNNKLYMGAFDKSTKLYTFYQFED
ncbi:hypothetical protein [Flavobacterium terrisoli]|uniref:hypothetical protein n=1 Tax=Flavobacterium terrisoli TaxID=3242195 RepID=UPI002543791B|nr:hypothetical protein [Flavobacterium buctense]